MLYHGTTLKSLLGIAKSGLTPTEPAPGDIWPEYDDENDEDEDCLFECHPEFIEPRAYLTRDITVAKDYAVTHGFSGGVVLAIETDVDLNESDHPEFPHPYATESIPVKDICVVCPETGDLLSIEAYLSDPRVIPKRFFMCVPTERLKDIAAFGISPTTPSDNETWPEFWGKDAPPEAREPRIVGYLTPEIAREMTGDEDGMVTLSICTSTKMHKNDVTGQTNGMANQLYTVDAVPALDISITRGPYNQSLSSYIRHLEAEERASPSPSPSL